LKEFYNKDVQHSSTRKNSENLTSEDATLEEQDEYYQVDMAMPKGSNNSTWIPPEGHNNNLDLYINCFRKRADAEIIK